MRKLLFMLVILSLIVAGGWAATGQRGEQASRVPEPSALSPLPSPADITTSVSVANNEAPSPTAEESLEPEESANGDEMPSSSDTADDTVEFCISIEGDAEGKGWFFNYQADEDPDGNMSLSGHLPSWTFDWPDPEGDEDDSFSEEECLTIEPDSDWNHPLDADPFHHIFPDDGWLGGPPPGFCVPDYLLEPLAKTELWTDRILSAEEIAGLPADLPAILSDPEQPFAAYLDDGQITAAEMAQALDEIWQYPPTEPSHLHPDTFDLDGLSIQTDDPWGLLLSPFLFEKKADLDRIIEDDILTREEVEQLPEHTQHFLLDPDSPLAPFWEDDQITRSEVLEFLASQLEWSSETEEGPEQFFSLEFYHYPGNPGGASNDNKENGALRAGPGYWQGLYLLLSDGVLTAEEIEQLPPGNIFADPDGIFADALADGQLTVEEWEQIAFWPWDWSDKDPEWSKDFEYEELIPEDWDKDSDEDWGFTLPEWEGKDFWFDHHLWPHDFFPLPGDDDWNYSELEELTCIPRELVPLLLNDGVLTTDEIEQLPIPELFTGPDGLLGEELEDGQITIERLLELYRSWEKVIPAWPDRDLDLPKPDLNWDFPDTDADQANSSIAETEEEQRSA